MSPVQGLHALRTAALTKAFGAQASGFADLLDETAKVAFDSCKLDVGRGGRSVCEAVGELWGGTKRGRSLEGLGEVGGAGELILLVGCPHVSFFVLGFGGSLEDVGSCWLVWELGRILQRWVLRGY